MVIKELLALDLDDETLTILNEHMERLKIICPKEYNRVMDELRKRGEWQCLSDKQAR